MDHLGISDISATYSGVNIAREDTHSQLHKRTEQGRTKGDVSEYILAFLFRTPVDLSDGLPADFGDVDGASPTLTLGILQALSNLNLGREYGGLDQEFALVGRVQEGHGRGIACKPIENQGGIHRGIRKADVEGGIAGEGVDQEFTTGVIFSGRDEIDVAVNWAVRSSDEKFGETGMFIPIFVKILSRVVREGDVDGDGGVPGLEYQELSGGEVSDDDVFIGRDFSALDV